MLFASLRLCQVHLDWFLKESAVDSFLSPSQSLKALGPANTHLSSVHFTSVPQTRRRSCMQTHTHTGTPRQLQACIYVYPQRHAHLLLMLKSLLILSLCTFMRTTSSLICSTMQTLKTHGKLQTNKTVQKPAKIRNIHFRY